MPQSTRSGRYLKGSNVRRFFWFDQKIMRIIKGYQAIRNYHTFIQFSSRCMPLILFQPTLVCFASVLLYIGKSLNYTLDYSRSPIFNLQLQNRITHAIQLYKPSKFGLRVVSKAVLYFKKLKKF